MFPNPMTEETIQISQRFRTSMEERIAKLQRDAASDEQMLPVLTDADHRRRHMLLISAQRAEALRMLLFLEQARTRLPRPLIAL